MESLQTVSTFQTWGINCFQQRSGKINGEKLVSECHEKPGAFLKKKPALYYLTNNQSQQKLIAKSANDSAIIKFMLLNIAEQMKGIVPLRALYKATYKQWASKMQFRACKHSRSRLFFRELRKITQVPGLVHFTSHLNTSSLASKHLSVYLNTSI